MRRIQNMGAIAIWMGLCAGCTDDKAGSTSSTASEATADSTSGEPTTSGETTGEPTTGVESTGESTGGEPGTSTSGSSGSSCEMFAENIAMCDPEADEAELVMECEAQQMSAGPGCAAAFDAYVECFADAPCDDPQSCESVYQDYLACMNPVDETCATYGAKLEECMQVPAFEGSAICQQQLDELEPTPACHDAYEAFIVCYSMLSCVDIEMAMGCEEEMNAFAGCGG